MATAIIAGASGFIGTFLTDILLNSEAYTKVKILVRKPLAISHPKLQQCIVSFDDKNALAACIEKEDIVFCCLGTTMKIAGSKEAFYKVDYTYPAYLGEIAKSKGVSRFLIVTAGGSSEKSLFYYSQVKGKIEQYLQSLGFDSLHIFRPALLMGERKEHRVGEKMAQKIMTFLNFFMVGPLKRGKGIRGKTVAESLYRHSLEANKGVFIWESEQI